MLIGIEEFAKGISADSGFSGLVLAELAISDPLAFTQIANLAAQQI
jgi:ribosomal protein L20